MRRVPLPKARAGRVLLGAWAVLLLSGTALGGTLEWLGPPRRPIHKIAVAPPRQADHLAMLVPHPAPIRRAALLVPAPVATPSVQTGIAAPDSSLLEPSTLDATRMLPRISAGGGTAREIYAARPPLVPSGAKRIAILLDGVGLSTADSLDAIYSLPASVSLAVSPYAVTPGAVLDAARKAGHELLLSLPMEPENSPADDEGSEALTEQLDPAENLQRLDWSLSRIQGYAGVTNASAGLDGAQFAASPQFGAISQVLARRGLFYLDATPGGTVPAAIPAAAADLRLDDPPDAAGIEGQLARLEQIAMRNGSAIGVAGPLYPVTIQRIADWAHTLPSHGIVLVPVSNLVHPMEKSPQIEESQIGESQTGESRNIP